MRKVRSILQLGIICGATDALQTSWVEMNKATRVSSHRRTKKEKKKKKEKGILLEVRICVWVRLCGDCRGASDVR